jgi:hypothetical protein
MEGDKTRWQLKLRLGAFRHNARLRGRPATTRIIRHQQGS